MRSISVIAFLLLSILKLVQGTIIENFNPKLQNQSFISGFQLDNRIDLDLKNPFQVVPIQLQRNEMDLCNKICVVKLLLRSVAKVLPVSSGRWTMCIHSPYSDAMTLILLYFFFNYNRCLVASVFYLWMQERIAFSAIFSNLQKFHNSKSPYRKSKKWI